MNIAKDEEKKAWKEQERLSELKKEAEVMAFKGYEAEAIIKRLDTLPRDLAEKNQYIGLLLEQRDEMKLKITDLRQRILKLRRKLGIKPKTLP